MGKRQLEKARLVGLLGAGTPGATPDAPPAAPVLNRSTPTPAAAAPAPARTKTAPGTMLNFMASQSAAIQEADQLRSQLKEFEGATPVRALDPRSIVRSKWSNRHEHSFNDAEFERLKAEIRDANGNVQPIKVRPKADEPGVYELVFGHRRHQASLELGIPVNAMVEALSEQQLFEQMERENRTRADLSPWEQGCMYAAALDEGLYPSMRQLADKLGVDVSQVSKSIALARLPADVVAAFKSPLELQYRWAQPLSEVQQKDPEGLLRRAEVLKAIEPRPAAARVFAVLCGQEVLNRSTPADKALEIRKHGKRLAALTTDAKGRALLTFEAGVLPASSHKALLKLVEDFLKT